MQRFGTCRLGFTIAVLIGALLATPVTAQTPSPVSAPATAFALAVRSPTTTPPVDPTPPGRALLISDSAWLSFKLYGAMDSVQGFDHTLALASCRRRVSTSCTNYDGFVPNTLYEELNNHPDGYATLIVATGYNDSDRNFTEDIRDITTLARSHGYPRIVWLTLRANVSYLSPDDTGFAEVFERSNAALRQIVEDGTYPELVIADWATFARDQHDWFSNDGIHLRTAGTYAAGDYISRKMAFLDAQPCPQPAYAGVEPINPCPDPDVHGPVIDLESLYPLGERGPDASFQLSWEGSSSWPAAPWWEL
jgi:hypothetical protein